MTRPAPSALLAAAALAAALCVGGCGPSNAAVNWADQVCGAFVPFLDLPGKAPKADPNDPAGAKERVSKFFTQAVAAADKGLAELAKAGPSPISDGDAAVTQVKAYLDQTRDTFADIKANLEALDVKDEAGFRRVVAEANTSLARLTQGQAVLDALDANQEFSQAAVAAANCQRVRAVRASQSPSR